MGTIESTAIMPVCKGWSTDFLGMIPGAEFFQQEIAGLIGRDLVINRPTSSINNSPQQTLPNRNGEKFRLSVLHPLLLENWYSPNKTQPTVSSSRLRAIPKTSFGNSTISLNITLERPSTLATPSAKVTIVPTFVWVASVERFSISFR